VISTVLRQHPIVLENSGLEEWPATIQLILNAKDDLTNSIGKHLSTPTFDHKDKHPFYGIYLTSNPLYSILINQHQSHELNQLYNYILVHVIASHAQLMRTNVSLRSYESDEYMVSILGALNSSVASMSRIMMDVTWSTNQGSLLAINSLHIKHTADTIEQGKTMLLKILSNIKSKCLANNFTTLLELTKYADLNPYSPLKLVHSNFRTFGTTIARLHQIQRSDIQNKFVQEAGVFFIHAFYDPSTKDSKGGGKKYRKVRFTSRNGFTVLSNIMVKYSLTHELDSGSTVEQITEVTNLKDLNELDYPPGDIPTGTETYLIGSGELEYTKSFLSKYLAAKAQARQIVMSNQLIKGRWSTMTLTEASVLVTYCESELDKINDAHVPDIAKYQYLVLILIMFWTGSTLNRARLLHVRTSSEPENADLTYITDNQIWRMTSDMVYRRVKPTEAQIKLSKQRSQALHLPDIAGLGKHIAFLKHHQQEPGLLFELDEPLYRKEILKILNSFNGLRLNENRITNYILNLIINSSGGNIAAACLATSSPHALSRTSLFYLTPTEEYIRSIYIKAAEPAYQYINQKTQKTTHVLSYDTNGKYTHNNHVGSDFCPKTEVIQSFIKNIKASVSQRLQTRSNQEYIDYHNIYTIYTLQMFAYATGYRSIQNPFINLNDIDEDTGFATLTDKDNASHYHTRLTWIPEVLIKQMHNYADHRNHVVQQAMLRNDQNNLFKTCPFLFLLDDDYTVMEIRPKHTLPMIEKHFPFPPNVNRRYLRTTLEERGCSIEVINCFMGHWSRGEEPWSKHSSFSFSDYRREIKEHIPEMLHNLGWQARKSLITI
jgi:hypothetical protein